SLREYRDKVALLCARIPSPTVYMLRPRLEKRIAQSLDENGLLLIRGGPGCGKSSLLSWVVSRRISDEKEPPARPIFYISCDEPGVPSKTPLKLFSHIARLMDKYNELLSDNKIHLLRSDELESIVLRLSRKKVIVVVDNFNFPSSPQRAELWT